MTEAMLTMYDDHGRRVPMMLAPGYETVEPQPDTQQPFDLRAITSAIYRNRFLVLAVLALSLAAGLAVTMLTTPVYRASASVQIEQQASRVLESQDVSPEQGQDADRFLQTQLDVLRSRTLANRVAQSLNLFNDSRFMVAMGERTAAQIGNPSGADREHRLQVINLLRDNMGVTLPRDSRIATINFDSPDPQVATRVANSFAEGLILSNLQRKYDASSYARTFLQQQLAAAKQRLEEAERASIAYARSAQLIDASAGAVGTSATETGPRSLVTASLIDLNNALSAATAARVAAEQKWRQAQITPVMSLMEVQTNSAIQDLARQRAEQQASYEEQRTRRKDDFPAMKQAQARIAELDQQIARLAGLVRNTVRDQYQIAANQENALRVKLGQLKGETLAEQDRSVRLNILRREVETSRTLYDGLLQRFKELSAEAGISANNISIVDRADIPTTPLLPRPLLNLALAGLAGLAVSMLLIFLRETFDDAIRSHEDVERKLRIGFLGSVPVLPIGETPLTSLGNPRSAFSEAHYALRSSLEFATATGLPRTLLCTSSLQGEGKSTTSMALAQSFARIGRRVLLIDGDLRKPSLHRLLNVNSEIGFSNVLTKQMTAEVAVQQTDTPNLSILTSGPLPPNPAELLASASIKELLADLVRRYDVVLIDGPPVMGLADAPILGSLVEGVVFVCEASRAHRGQAKIALRRLRESRAVVLGTILTKFDSRQIGYGADYGYSYNYGVEDKSGARRNGGLLARLTRRTSAENE